MSTSVKAPRDMIAAKPPHGSPCNRCGLCCTVALCDLGQHMFERPAMPGPCPALRRIPEGYECAFTACPGLPEVMRAAAAVLINAGNGCDMRLDGERNDEYSARMDARDAEWERAGILPAARRHWGMRS